jgi:hypothetical protein
MKKPPVGYTFPERERFCKMPIDKLYGMIGNRQEHLRDNLRNGIFKSRPEILDGILYALKTRKDELEEHRIEYQSRPKKLALANAAKRSEEVGPNGETSETHDFVTEKHKTGGKGQMVSAGTWVKRQTSTSLAG